MAEIDILEFFTKAFGENPYPAKANQTLHLFNSETQKLGINLPKVRYDILKSETISREIISMYIRFR